MTKRILCPGRLRRVPKQFSWVDQRLVRDGHIHKLCPESAALYLLLITVGDSQGISYYSDAAIRELISLDDALLSTARRQLVSNGLIAYQKPLYQVLALEQQPRRSAGEPQTVTEILLAISKSCLK